MDQASFIAALIDKVSGPARKMKTQLSGLNKAFKHVTKGAEKSRDNMGRFVAGSGGWMKKLEGSFKGAGDRLGSAFQTGVTRMKEGLLLGGVAAAGVAAGVGTAAVKMADFAQTSRLGYQAAAKYGASAEKLFAFARLEAERLGQDVMATSDAFRSFLTQGADPKMAGQLVRMGADMNTFGASAAQVESVLYNVKKILAQGKAQGDELGPIFEVMNAPKFWNNLGKSIGKTKDQLLKMKDAGQLTADMILPALIETSTQMAGGSYAGQAAEKAADATFRGMFGKLKAQAQNAFIDIGTQITPVLMALKPLTDELGQLFKSKGFQEGVVVAFETVGQVLRDAIPLVKSFVGGLGQGFAQMWPHVKGALGMLSDTFGGNPDWLKTMKEAGQIIGQRLAVVVGALGFAVGVAATAFRGGVAAITAFQGALVTVGNAIGGALFAVSDLVANVQAKWEALKIGAFNAATGIITGLVTGLQNGAQWVVATIGQLGAQMLAKFESVLKIGSPSKEFEYFGQMSGLGFSQGLEHSLRANDNDVLLPSARTATSGASLAHLFTGGGGDTYVDVHVDIHIDGSGDPVAVAQEVKRSLRTELAGALEHIALERAG